MPAATIKFLQRMSNRLQKDWATALLLISPPQSGAVLPNWTDDDAHESCTLCSVEFSFFRRRHHCRYGLLACNSDTTSNFPCRSHSDSRHIVCGILLSIGLYWCRLCGCICCFMCSSKKSSVPRFKIRDERVCDHCFFLVLAMEPSQSTRI